MSENGRMNGKRAIGICGTGTFTDLTPGMMMPCVCCGKKFKTWEIAVELFECDIVCPDCILSGPKEMARRIREGLPKIKEGWIVKLLLQIAGKLDKKESIADFPGGIFAVKIAEAYRELDNRPKAGQARKAA